MNSALNIKYDFILLSIEKFREKECTENILIGIIKQKKCIIHIKELFYCLVLLIL